MENITPKLRAGKNFSDRLSQQAKARLERLAGQKLFDLEISPTPAPETHPRGAYNRRQDRTISRKADGERLARKAHVTREEEAKKRQKKKAQNQRHDWRFIARLQDRLKAAGIGDEEARQNIRAINRAIWMTCRHILADSSGKAARYYLARSYNREAVRLIKQAAGADLTSSRARNIVALGLALIALSADTNRRGKWRRIVRGIPQAALKALLQNPYSGRRPSRSTISGLHANTDQPIRPYDLGYLDALKKAGFCYSQQLPKSAVARWEALGDYALNRYWIIAARPDPLTLEELAELLATQPPPEIIENRCFSRAQVAATPEKTAPSTAPP